MNSWRGLRERTVTDGFLRAEHRNQILVADEAEQLLDLLDQS